MAFCSKCGQSLRDGAKFCSSCGALVTSPTPAAPIVPTIPAPNVQKRAGRLAVIGFLVSLALTIAVDVTTSDKTLNYVGIVIAFAIGAVFIILNLRRWEKKHEIVRGAAIGWTIAGVLILGCIGGLANIAEGNGSRTSSISSPEKLTMIPAKYDEAQAVIKLCGTPSQDHPQELHAGAGGEGRALVYRRYNTELWFYRGPSSSRWMLEGTLEAKGDDSITVEEANKRMPCLRGSLEDHMRAPQNEEEKAAVESTRSAAQSAEATQKASDDKKYSDLSTRAAIGAASLKAAMRNPDSLKLESVLGMDDGTICYEYRAQNGFGGINRELATLLPNAKSLTTSTAAWNKQCAKRRGQDVTYSVETMMKLFH